MADIETLTEEECAHLREVSSFKDTLNDGEVTKTEVLAGKALRILDAQALRISELEQQLAKARQRIGTLEAQVLSSDTVAKAEYQQMVQQRDTMRQERNAAREKLELLQMAIAEDEAGADATEEEWAEDATGVEGIAEAIWVAETEGQDAIVGRARADLAALVKSREQLDLATELLGRAIVTVEGEGSLRLGEDIRLLMAAVGKPLPEM